MKKSNKVIILASCIMVIIFAAHATNAKSEDLSVSGNIKLTGQHYAAISVSGNLDADKVTATGKTSVSGNTNISNSQLHSVAISGSTALTNSQINGDVDVSGRFTIVHSDIKGEALSCSGDLQSNQSNYATPVTLSGNLSTHEDNFHNSLIVSGDINADKSNFEKTITLSSSKSSWKNSVLSANIINNTDTTYNTPTIILDNSQVKGKIEFTKTKGLVILKGTSKVSGQIENAEVKHL